MKSRFESQHFLKKLKNFYYLLPKKELKSFELSLNVRICRTDAPIVHVYVFLGLKERKYVYFEHVESQTG